MSCEYGKQLKRRCLEECESAIDAAYDFYALTTICKNQHIKNKEVKETMKEDVPTATLQEKKDAIVQAINQIIANAKNAAKQGSPITLIDGNKLVELVIKYQLYITPVTTYILDDFYND